MKRKSLSQVKNLMRRALIDLVDPPPSQADQRQLRAHFADRCCYCGADAPPRKGHLDHADPGGGNGLGNLLLSCGACNGDEKREQGWAGFLLTKCGSNSAVHTERHARIKSWLDLHRAERRPVPEDVARVYAAAEDAIGVYEAAYSRLRAMLQARDLSL